MFVTSNIAWIFYEHLTASVQHDSLLPGLQMIQSVCMLLYTIDRLVLYAKRGQLLPGKIAQDDNAVGAFEAGRFGAPGEPSEQKRLQRLTNRPLGALQLQLLPE